MRTEQAANPGHASITRYNLYGSSALDRIHADSILIVMADSTRQIAGEIFKFGRRSYTSEQLERYLIVGGRQYSVVGEGGDYPEDIITGHYGDITRTCAIIPDDFDVGSPQALCYNVLRGDGMSQADATIVARAVVV